MNSTVLLSCVFTQTDSHHGWSKTVSQCCPLLPGDGAEGAVEVSQQGEVGALCQSATADNFLGQAPGWAGPVPQDPAFLSFILVRFSREFPRTCCSPHRSRVLPQESSTLQRCMLLMGPGKQMESIIQCKNYICPLASTQALSVCAYSSHMPPASANDASCSLLLSQSFLTQTGSVQHQSAKRFLLIA